MVSKNIEDTLVDVKFSGMSWYKDEGFYYSSYDKPKGSALCKNRSTQSVFPQIGTLQKEDVLIFGGTKEENTAMLVQELRKIIDF